MSLKIFLACSICVGGYLSFTVQESEAQDVQTLIQETETTELLLNKGSEIPLLGPVEIDPIGAPGTAIAEDQYGFMWFGGFSGLYRYDGIEMIRFQHEAYDSTSLSETWVESLYAGSDGALWVGTFGGGLNRFDPETETFSHFKHQSDNPTSLSQDTVTVILEDSQGILWVGTHGGLNRFDPVTEKFTRFLHNPEDLSSLSNNQVRALFEDSNGIIWVGTGSPAPSETPVGEGGLNRFNFESQSFTRYLHNPNDSTSLLNNRIMSMYEDSRGTFWVGTSGDGLHSMDRRAGTFTRHQFDPNDPTKLSAPIPADNVDLLENCIGFNCGGVTFIQEDHQGMLWIGGLYAGVKRYQLKTGIINYYNPANSNFGANDHWSIYESQDGTLWIGGWGGASKVVASVNYFPLLTFSDESAVSSIVEGQNSGLWISTLYGNGLIHIDRQNGTMSQYLSRENDPNSIISDYVSKIDSDGAGNLWMLYGYGGISRYEVTSDRFNTYFDDQESGLNVLTKNSIIVDQNGQLWVGTFGSGLFQLDPGTRSVIKNYTHNPNDINSLSDDRVYIILESRDGDLWVGTHNGLNFIDRNPENDSGDITIKRYLPEQLIGGILEGDNDYIWVGTNNGLFRLDPETGETLNVTSEDGLPKIYVPAILQDDEGYLWLSTFDESDNGILSRFDPNSLSFTNFTPQAGLPDIVFNRTALKTQDGLLFFGGIGGTTFFDPSNIQEPNYRSPKIALTGIQVSNEQITPATSDLLSKPVYMEDSIQLSYEQNDVTIDYKAFAYSNQDQIQYQYQLEPFDSDWVLARSQQSARYSQIPPGEYRFRVRTIDSRGGYSTEEAILGITILPPWWRSWWAYGLYTLFLSFGIFVVDRFQRRRLIAKERERSRDRELEQEKRYSKDLQDAYSELEDSLKKLKAAQDQLIQQEKLASLGQLTAGIAHEIKNPLNFVNNFSDLSEELIQELINAMKNGDLDEAEELANDISKNLQKIHKHGTRADSIVKSMLQHSRGGDGKMEPTPLNPLIKEYVNLAFHGMRAGNDPIDVDIELQLDEGVGEVPLVAEDFSRVVLNLVNNAFDALRETSNVKGETEESPFEGGKGGEAVQGDDAKPGYSPKLTVRTKSSANTVIIEIEDNGPGIPDEMKDKILQPFFTTKKGTQGTGLGLSITNDIIKAHGGSLEVQSKAGQTVFTITLAL